MATVPHAQHLDEDFDLDGSNAQLPGYTVDALLEQGKVEEARAELERLCLEGLDSGDPQPMNDELFHRIVAKARSQSERTAR